MGFELVLMYLLLVFSSILSSSKNSHFMGGYCIKIDSIQYDIVVGSTSRCKKKMMSAIKV